MEERTLDVHVVSGEELKRVKRFGKQKSFVMAYIYANQKKATRVDFTGNLSPTWNHKLTLTVDERLMHQPGTFVTLEVRSQGFLSKKLIGIVTIPLQEISRDHRFATKPQILAFQVRQRSGEVNGVLNLAVKLGSKRIVRLHQPGLPNYRLEEAGHGPQQGPSREYAAPQYGYDNQQQELYGAPQYGHRYQQHEGRYGAYQERRRGGGGGGSGFGAGLLGGALGGLVLGEMMDDDMGDSGGGDF